MVRNLVRESVLARMVYRLLGSICRRPLEQVLCAEVIQTSQKESYLRSRVLRGRKRTGCCVACLLSSYPNGIRAVESGVIDLVAVCRHRRVRISTVSRTSG